MVGLSLNQASCSPLQRLLPVFVNEYQSWRILQWHRLVLSVSERWQTYTSERTCQSPLVRSRVLRYLLPARASGLSLMQGRGYSFCSMRLFSGSRRRNTKTETPSLSCIPRLEVNSRPHFLVPLWHLSDYLALGALLPVFCWVWANVGVAGRVRGGGAGGGGGVISLAFSVGIL